MSKPPRSTDPFDDFYLETHGGTGRATWEDDDIPEHDEMNDSDE